ncbi:histone-fold-containing protein [Pisolithus orientalis]|uniref:histone-fold-containing protein n=1 Tax=Pisolithus orientalis TaxID=936130 RepID=UPI002224894C|nr:histone-fold-containing protein [Pisolithus orientalis]KAI5985448.1 histone-fold-containing protein [Pisolithus orientalis]
MPRKDTGSGPISAQAQQDLVSEGIENFELPKSLVTKIAKSAIPDNAKLQKETVLSLVKGSTVFINYLGVCLYSCLSTLLFSTLKLRRRRHGYFVTRPHRFNDSFYSAHDVALSKQHKSISASDVLKALEMIEFGDLVEKLQEELQIYRDNTKGDKGKKSAVVPSGKGKAKEKITSSVSQSAAEELYSGSPVRDEGEMGEVVGDEDDEGEVDDVVEHDEEEEPLDTMHIETEELQRDAAELHEFPADP